MWSPWHGCHRISTGCRNCWLYYLDAKHGRDAGEIFRSKTKFQYPIQKDRQGNYKVPSGNQVATCFTSDFFLEEADEWREEAWSIIRQRPDLEFYIPTKRIARFLQCIPSDWGDGWDNVNINVSVENQAMVEERIPLLLSMPIKKRGIYVAPMLEDVELEPYLSSGKIALVSVSGESYENARECKFDWVLHVKEQCDKYHVEFGYHQTGSNFIYQGKRYQIPHQKEQEQARKAFLQHRARTN